MEMVYRTTVITEAYLVRGILEDNGINCIVKNDLTQYLSGEMAYSSAWPEVWIALPEDRDRANELIADFNNRTESESWTCPDCGEKIEGEFDACWRCGAFRDGSKSAN